MNCPYCASDEGCEHHLLSIDMGEREACGGALYELFKERWKQVRAQGYENDDDFDESVEFDQFLSEVEELATQSAGETAGGLASGEFEDFFCATAAEVKIAVDLYATRYGPRKNLR